MLDTMKLQAVGRGTYLLHRAHANQLGGKVCVLDRVLEGQLAQADPAAAAGLGRPPAGILQLAWGRVPVVGALHTHTAASCQLCGSQVKLVIHSCASTAHLTLWLFDGSSTGKACLQASFSLPGAGCQSEGPCTQQDSVRCAQHSSSACLGQGASHRVPAVFYSSILSDVQTTTRQLCVYSRSETLVV